MDLLHYSFFINALIGIIIVAAATAMIGMYVTTRRMVFLSGGITHACFGGLGMGYWLGINPMIGAALFAIGGALGVEWMDRRNVRNESAIAVVWALGMALGTLLVLLTNGYVPELNTFLFGNVLTITRSDLWLFGGFTAALAAFFGVMYRYIVAVSFDPDFARTRRLPVAFVNTAMTVFTALAIVMTIRMVGIMLLMSMVTLPQMTAELFTERYSRMLLASGVISVALCVLGLVISALVAVPASATIVLAMVACYTVARIIGMVNRKLVSRRDARAGKR